MKHSADWFSWSLQFIAGLVVGAVVSLMFLGEHSRSGRGAGLVEWRNAPIFIAGAALIGAALASFYGDRLWLGDSYRVIPPDDIAHTDLSRIASIVVGVLGGLLVLAALLRQFGWL